jgi:hypothetical protein
MKKCTHCGYKNSNEADSCNLCSNRLPKDPTPERPTAGAVANEPFHEPRKWAGSGGPPARIQRGPAAEGSAAPGPRADVNTERHYLVPPTGDVVRLELDKVATIGRDAACQIKIASGKVSRRHADIRWEGNPPKPFLWDLGSQNGTYVNERKLESRGKHALADGDEIEIGDVKEKYRCLAPGVPEQTLGDMAAATIVAEAASDPDLTGNAAILPIGEVLRRLETLHASGTLDVDVGGHLGRIVIEAGRAISGTYAGLEGSAAISAITALKQGRFRFEEDEPAPGGGRTIPSPPRDSTAAPGSKAPPPPPRGPAPAPKNPPK